MHLLRITLMPVTRPGRVGMPEVPAAISSALARFIVATSKTGPEPSAGTLEGSRRRREARRLGGSSLGSLLRMTQWSGQTWTVYGAGRGRWLSQRIWNGFPNVVYESRPPQASQNRTSGQLMMTFAETSVAAERTRESVPSGH